MADPILYWDYFIDGVARYKVGWYGSEAGHQFLEEKRIQEIDTLAAPLIVPLKIAAESWRTVVEGGDPSYGPLFEGYIVVSKAPPEQPWALIVGGRRIFFEVGNCLKYFAHVRAYVPFEVFNSIPFASSVVNGARVVTAPGLPHAFVLKGGDFDGYLLKFDSSKAQTANGSFPELITGEQYHEMEQHHYGDIHAYPYTELRSI